MKLTAELKKYMSALKEETAKRSEAVDMVNILKITKDSESKIEKLMNILKIQDSEHDPEGPNTNAWTIKGKEGGFKRNNKPKQMKVKSNNLMECPPCGKNFHEREIKKNTWNSIFQGQGSVLQSVE